MYVLKVAKKTDWKVNSNFCYFHRICTFLRSINSLWKFFSCWLPTRFRPSFKHFLCLVNLALCAWPQLFFTAPCTDENDSMMYIGGGTRHQISACRKIYPNFLTLCLLKEAIKLVDSDKKIEVYNIITYITLI